MTQSACFITLEGLDGAGKSTHVDWMADRLRSAGIDLLCTREPGGTPLGEQLRELLLHEPMDAGTEALLMFAARNEHWHRCIRPALQRGQWVLCDRYTDASYAYQGGGRAMGAAAIADLEAWMAQRADEPPRPDRTFFFDVPLEVARDRLRNGRKQADRFEREAAAFFQRTREAYHTRIREDPARFCVLDGCGAIADIRLTLSAALDRLIRQYGKPLEDPP